MQPRSNQARPQIFSKRGGNRLKWVGPSIGPARRPGRSAVASSWIEVWPPYSWSASICRGWRKGPLRVSGVSKLMTWSPFRSLRRRSFAAQRLGGRPVLGVELGFAEVLAHAGGEAELHQPVAARRIGRPGRRARAGRGAGLGEGDPAGVHGRGERAVVVDDLGGIVGNAHLAVEDIGVFRGVVGPRDLAAPDHPHIGEIIEP